MSDPIRFRSRAASVGALALLAAAGEAIAQEGVRARGDDDRRGAITASDMDLRVTPVVKAVRQNQDAVVSLYVVHEERTRGQSLLTADGQGSGVVLDQSGLVITNWHVVAPAADPRTPYRVVAVFPSGDRHAAAVLSTSAEHDLALLQLELPEGKTVKPILLGDSATLMIGEPTIAIGNPRGQANTVTVGVLSAIDRSIHVRTPDGSVRQYAGLLQTDAAINQGNSGGALLDITGKLIGINNAMAMGAENIGFAIPVNTVKRVFQDVLLSSENLASVWLGMRVTDGPDAAVVASVDPRGPAARAGIREGDQLTAANGEPVRNALDYARRVLQARPGQPFPLELKRRAQREKAQVVPISSAEWELLRRAGLAVERITAADDPELVRRATIEFYSESGRRRVPLLEAVLRVTEVSPDSPAAELDLRRGDLLLGLISADSFWGARTLALPSVETLTDFLRVYAGRRATLIIQRGEEGYVGDLSVLRL
jgi:S1-C subfamily serine protease